MNAFQLAAMLGLASALGTAQGTPAEEALVADRPVLDAPEDEMPAPQSEWRGYRATPPGPSCFPPAKMI